MGSPLSIFSPVLTYPATNSASSDKNSIKVPEGLENIWDPNKYISLDEIKQGMEAYCLTEYSPVGVEKFGLEIIDVVRDIDVGKNIILVKGIWNTK